MNNINYYANGGLTSNQQLQMLDKIQEDLTKAVEEIKNQTPGEGCQAIAAYPDEVVQALSQQNPQIGEIIKVAKQMVGLNTISAKLGSKLSYIKSLKSECPIGQELVYYRANGGICKACVAAKEKCGGKTTKKAIRKDCGGNKMKKA